LAAQIAADLAAGSSSRIEIILANGTWLFRLSLVSIDGVL
jgi:hypothetical protein